MKPTTTRRCAIYARISVTSDESVSIGRQVEAAEQYAAARGWQVVEVFRDDGVSATHSKPEARAGWGALVASPKRFDAVVIWKVDRLARRVLDFLHADETLQARGAGIVCVEQTIDMTTAEGRGFATMLAVFGEMEAAAISARVAAARTHLLRAGRVVGGKVPYGWRSVPNPDGPGLVLAQDPATIDYVRGMVDRVQRGSTVYGVKQWLDEVGAPTPGGRSTAWRYATVERVLRHPVLAGMTSFNPGRTSEKTRGDEVLRNQTGLPVVDESVALLPVGEWRALVKALDDRDSAQAAPRATRSKTSSLLSGLLLCGKHDEPLRMHRGTIQGRPAYNCPTCHQTISNFEDIVVEEFLEQKGEQLRWRRVEEIHEGGAALLPEIEHRLDELDALIRTVADRESRHRLQAEQGTLLDLRDQKREESPKVEYRWEGTDQTFAADWAGATVVEERRAILDDALTSITVTPGGRGRRSREQLLARLAFDWKGDVGPHAEPDESWVT